MTELMRTRSTELESSLFALSALLPGDKVRAASNELIKRYVEGHGHLDGHLVWGDFKDTQFLVGGSSKLDGSEPQIYSSHLDNDVTRALHSHYPLDSTPVGRVILSADGDWLYWFTSNGSAPVDKQVEAPVRGFAISQNLFGEVLDVFNSTLKLTKAEKRAAFHVVGGISVNESAELDSVSVETKRTQIKQSCTKLDCRGQTQLVKLIVGQLAHLISVSSAETSSVSVADRFVDQYLPDDARLTVVRLPNGRLVRYLDSGPENGRPVVFNYAIPYPNTLVNAGPFLEANNLRIVTPLRFGYLEPEIYSEDSPELRAYDHADDDIIDLVRFLFRQPVAIIGSSTATVNTIRLIDKAPVLFDHLICLSPILGTLGGEVSRDLGEFFRGLLDAAKTEGSVARLGWVMRQFNTDSKVLAEVMMNIYGENKNDVRSLSQEINGHTVFDALADAYRYSYVGTTVDFTRAIEDWESPFQRLRIPITILRGAADTAVSAKILQRLSELNADVSVCEIETGGHFITSLPSHAKETWAHIARVLT